MTSSSSSSSSSSPPLDVRLLQADDLLQIFEVVLGLMPAAIIIDSIQTVRDPNSTSRPGSVTQVCAVDMWGRGRGV
jgi:predicted ATP-dependent serine protease